MTDCVKTYVLDQDMHIQGNKIFRRINTKLDTENENLSKAEKQSLEECMKLLEDAEKVRIEIAKKFELFLYHTGACVLTQPTMERGLMTYILNILVQILNCAYEKNIKFDMRKKINKLNNRRIQGKKLLKKLQKTQLHNQFYNYYKTHNFSLKQ